MSDTLVILPDTARMVVEFLLNQTEVTDLCDERVWTDLPTDPTFPAVRVTRLGGSPNPGPYWLETSLHQIDVFGSGRHATSRLAETCRSALVLRLPGIATIGADRFVVTRASVGGITEGSGRYRPGQPDARFDLSVTAHPAP